MRGIILAAGKGSRAQALTRGGPKCLLKIGGKTLLDRQLDALERHGIGACVVVGHMEERVIEACEGRDVEFVFNSLYETTGPLASLMCARHHLREGFYQLLGDVCFEDAVLDALVRSSEGAAVAVKIGPCRPCDAMVRTEAGRVTEIGSRVSTHAACGVYVMGKFSAGAAQVLMEEVDRAEEQDAILAPFVDGVQGLIDRGHRVGSVDVSDHGVLEIDYPEYYRRAAEVFC